MKCRCVSATFPFRCRHREKMVSQLDYCHCQKRDDCESRGLGDTVAKVFRATALDKIAAAFEAVIGKPCGCDERQETLNEMFPRKPK